MKFSIAVSALLAGFAVAAPLQAEQGNAKRVVITNRLLGGGIKIGASDQEIPGVKEVIGANGTLEQLLEEGEIVRFGPKSGVPSMATTEPEPAQQ